MYVVTTKHAFFRVVKVTSYTCLLQAKFLYYTLSALHTLLLQGLLILGSKRLSCQRGAADELGHF